MFNIYYKNSFALLSVCLRDCISRKIELRRKMASAILLAIIVNFSIQYMFLFKGDKRYSMLSVALIFGCLSFVSIAAFVVSIDNPTVDRWIIRVG